TSPTTKTGSRPKRRRADRGRTQPEGIRRRTGARRVHLGRGPQPRQEDRHHRRPQRHRRPGPPHRRRVARPRTRRVQGVTMAKATGIGWTTLSVDDSSGTPVVIKNDVTNLQFATPRGVQDVTGVDKSAIERLLLLADFSI